jgi:phosphotransferase system HPr (HPr) family protein
MAVVSRRVTVKNKQGLHARPAALFVQIANKYEADISVSKDNEVVNGKSIMGILMLGVESGSEINIKAEGQDAAQAISELEELISKEDSV